MDKRPEVLVIQDLKMHLTDCINNSISQGLPIAVISMIVNELQATLRGLEQEELKRAKQTINDTQNKEDV